MSCFGEQHRFNPGASVCNCGQRNTFLTGTGLPYASWRLEETSVRGLRHSNVCTASDTKTGQTYWVREYIPNAVADPQGQRRRFITVAKSLRNSPIPSERILFAYTRNVRCYTVSDPLSGTPLSALVTPGRTPESDCLAQLGALLSSLVQFHRAAAVAGPLFHGHLQAADILSTQSESPVALHLLHSLYLENLLRENPLPPEHFQVEDLHAAADIALVAASGLGGTRQNRLAHIADPVLGATLEYIFGAYGTRPHTAQAALDYLHLLQRASASTNRALFEQASGLSASPRLLPFTARQHQPAPQAPPQPAKPPSRPPPKPPVVDKVPPTTRQAPYRPVAAPPPAPRRRNTGCGGCLLTLLLAFFVVSAVTAVLLWRPKVPPTSLDFYADPNPALSRAPVRLHWSSSGFERLELDGKKVKANGSLTVIPSTSRRYSITGIRSDGSREIRAVNLDVYPRSSRLKRDTHPASPEAPKELPSGQVSQTQQLPNDADAFARSSSSSSGDDSVTPSGETTSSAPVVRELPSADLEEIQTTLAQWTGAMLANDPDRQAACYAPQLDRYFRRSGVTQDYVRQHLLALRNQGTTFTQFSISAPLIIPEPDGSVEARLSKDVTLSTSTGPKRLTAHTELRLKRIGDSWKITSERDLRAGLQP